MFDAMQHFVQVVEAGSFSHAAKRLNKNASSVARQIDRLEEDLGVQLFTRTTRRLDLTLHGQSFYQQCQDILKNLEETRQSFKAISPAIEGEIRISTLDSYGDEHLVPLLPKFLERYPNTRVTLSLDNSLIDLHEKPFDLTVRHGRPADSNYIYKPLALTGGVLLASPHYLAQHPPIKDPEQLKDHNCLTLFLSKQHTYWQFSKGNSTKKIRVEGRLSACGGRALIAWARQGLGITLCSSWYAKDLRESGELVEVLPDWRASITGQEQAMVYLLWKATAARRPAVRAMIDFLAEHLAEI